MSQAGVLDVQELPASDRPFNIETHGIDIIPLEDRHGSPIELFWIWAAALMGIVAFVIGAVIVSLGLNLWEAILAIVIGNLSYIFTGLVAMSGPAAGTSTIVISRAPFGVRGNALPTALSWLTILGWEGVNAVVGVLAVVELFKVAGLGAGTGVKVLSIVLFMGAMIILAIWGHATIAVVQKWLTYLLGITMLGVIYFGLQHVDWSYKGSSLAGGNTLATFILAVAIVMAADGIAFTNMPADFSRYLPPQASRSQIAWYTAIGAFIPCMLLQVIGAMIGTKLNMFDPIGSLQGVMPHWFLVPFLLIVAVGLVAANIINTYSSGLNLLALGVKIPRYQSVFFDGICATAFVVIAIFLYNFVNTLESFLALMIWWIASWTGIFLVDMYRRHFVYKSEDLLRGRGGVYWYRDGIHLEAIAALVGGAIASVLFTNSTLWVSPIVKHVLGGADLSIPAGLIVGGGLYWLLTRRRTAVEPEQVEAPELADQRA